MSKKKKTCFTKFRHWEHRDLDVHDSILGWLMTNISGGPALPMAAVNWRLWLMETFGLEEQRALIHALPPGGPPGWRLLLGDPQSALPPLVLCYHNLNQNAY